MRTSLKDIADKYIAPAQNLCILKFSDGVTDDIISEIMKTDLRSEADTLNFSHYLRGATPLDTLRNDYDFVKKHIKYIIDPAGDQYIKTPARIWADRFADCKGLSIFLASLLKNQNFKFAYRFASYSEKPIYTHVYIVVYLNGDEIVLDTVMPGFQQEKNFTYKKDILTMPKIYKMSGIDDAPQGLVKKDFNLGNRDIAEMSEGEMDLWIARDRVLAEKKIVEKIQGIGSLKAEKYQDTVDMLEDAIEAVQAATVNGIGAATAPDLEETLATIAHHAITGVYSNAESLCGIYGIGKTKAERKKAAADKKAARKKRKEDRKEIRKQYKGKEQREKMSEWRAANGTKTGKFLQKVAKKVKAGAKAVAKVLSAPMRLITKGILDTTLPKAPPAFIYLFVTDPKMIAKLPPEARAKRKKQEKIFKFIVEGVGMKEAHVMGILRNGIMKHMGDTPEKILAKQFAGKLSGIGFIEEAGKLAGGFLTKIIDWIIKLIKKKKGKEKELQEIQATDTDSVIISTDSDGTNPELANELLSRSADMATSEYNDGGDRYDTDGANSNGKSIWNSLK